MTPDPKRKAQDITLLIRHAATTPAGSENLMRLALARETNRQRHRTIATTQQVQHVESNKYTTCLRCGNRTKENAYCFKCATAIKKGE